MVSIQPVSRDRHQSKHWLRFENYQFAREEVIAPVVLAELPKAMHSFPIGFIQENEAFVPVALLGLARGRNLYVGPDGKWIGGYVPASLRGYPFRIGDTGEGNVILCVDEDSGLITDGPEGEPFFAEDGSLAPPTAKILDFLGQTYQNRAATQAVCKVLADKGLIVPWPVTLKSEDGERTLDGLHRVDEQALNALETEGFDEVRRAGALPLIYCQLLSMEHMGLLGRLAEAHAQRAALMAKAAPKVPDLAGSLTHSDSIDWSKFGM
jgi:hypothetical protein